MVSNTLSGEPVDERLLFVSLVGVLGVVAAALVLAGLASSVVRELLGVAPSATLRDQPLRYTLVSATTPVAILAAAAGYLALRDEWEILHVRRPTLRDAAVVGGGVVLLAVANVGVTAVISAVLAAIESAFGVSAEFGQHTAVTTGQRTPAILLYMIPVTLLLVGPAEELLFRGVVQGLLRRVTGVVPAVLLASLLFGLVHASAISSGSAWTYVVAAGSMGVVLGGVYEYTENIAVPAAVHGCWNAAIFAIQWANATDAVALPF